MCRWLIPIQTSSSLSKPGLNLIQPVIKYPKINRREESGDADKICEGKHLKHYRDKDYREEHGPPQPMRLIFPIHFSPGCSGGFAQSK